MSALLARTRSDPVAVAAEYRISPFEVVVAAALSARTDSVELAALRAEVRALREQVALLRETDAETRETAAAPAPAARHLSPKGALTHPYRALFDALLDVHPRGCVSDRDVARICGERDPALADRYVTRLRRRIEPAGYRVHYITGLGYRLDASGLRQPDEGDR